MLFYKYNKFFRGLKNMIKIFISLINKNFLEIIMMSTIKKKNNNKCKIYIIIKRNIYNK